MKKKYRRNPDLAETAATAAKWYFIYLPLIFLGVLGIGAYFFFRKASAVSNSMTQATTAQATQLQQAMQTGMNLKTQLTSDSVPGIQSGVGPVARAIRDVPVVFILNTNKFSGIF